MVCTHLWFRRSHTRTVWSSASVMTWQAEGGMAAGWQGMHLCAAKQLASTRSTGGACSSGNLGCPDLSLGSNLSVRSAPA